MNIKKTGILLSTTTVYRGCRIFVPETIKNFGAPKCITCKNYIPYAVNLDSFAKCKKFGVTNLVSGEIYYDYADSCRQSELKCGTNGKYYIHDEYHRLKREIIKASPFAKCTLIMSPVIFLAFINCCKQ
jgi:hypothetical protein